MPPAHLAGSQWYPENGLAPPGKDYYWLVIWLPFFQPRHLHNRRYKYVHSFPGPCSCRRLLNPPHNCIDPRTFTSRLPRLERQFPCLVRSILLLNVRHGNTSASCQ
jgi:hypothetical protein